jgi:uncharacterized protein (DUF1330 family)
MEDAMKTLFIVAASVVAGALIGSSFTGLNAQNKAPGAYAIVDISEITDATAFKEQLLPKVTPEILAQAGGKYVVRTDAITATDGTPPSRFVVIGFDSLEKAKAWNASASQQQVNGIRMKSTKSRQFLVEALQ